MSIATSSMKSTLITASHRPLYSSQISHNIFNRLYRMPFLIYVQFASSSRLEAAWGQGLCYNSFVFTFNSYYTAAYTDVAYHTFACWWYITNKIPTWWNFTLMVYLYYFYYYVYLYYYVKNDLTRCDMKIYFKFLKDWFWINLSVLLSIIWFIKWNFTNLDQHTWFD